MTEENIYCIIDVGHPEKTRAVWRDKNQPTLIVCDRHKAQHEERPDLGPYNWEPLLWYNRP